MSEPNSTDAITNETATNEILKQVWTDGHQVGRAAGYTCGYIDGLMHAAREAIDIGGKAKDDSTRLAVSNLAERLLSTARELIGQARDVAEGGAK